jgi:hypothetical protein
MTWKEKVWGQLLTRRIETGELASATGIRVIGAECVLQLFRCRAGSRTSFVPFALGIEGTG